MNAVQKLLTLVTRLVRIALFNPQRLSYIFGNALATTVEVVDKSVDVHRVPAVTVEDLLPPSGDPLRATLALFPQSNASVSILEFVSLILLIKKTPAKKLFEFGTYKGASVT